MMMEVVFAGLVFSVASVLLRNLGWRGAPVFASLALIVLFSAVFSHLNAFFEVSRTAFLGNAGEAISKIIGISYLFGISSDICRELGESAVASGLSLAGRLEMIAVSLPFLSDLVSGALRLAGGL